MRKFTKPTICLLLCLLLTLTAGMACADSSRANLFRFVPTIITVETSSVKVEGYFLNLNSDCDIKSHKNFDMTVYKDGDVLTEGDFGTINDFTVKAMGVKYQSFTFNGAHSLNNGVYECNDHFYTSFGCDFTYVEK